MRQIGIVVVILVLGFAADAQSSALKVYETEKAFEKLVAEKGLNAGFVEFLSPLGVMFFPE
ncbi:MAG TPA: hypothetical protein VK612_01745, partial [Pyrinomonadaceae bacterium]|nr:hypothetical protein [Pyrinomonadaceae bacterium]